LFSNVEVGNDMDLAVEWDIVAVAEEVTPGVFAKWMSSEGGTGSKDGAHNWMRDRKLRSDITRHDEGE
jgi:hypothetical protein